MNTKPKENKMKKNLLFLPGIMIIAALIFGYQIHAEENLAVEEEPGTFHFQLELKLPGTPEIIYDALTGDISPWWDHSFSEKPYRLYIEAKPGGGFYEIFNENGDGALHARVIYAHRGKLLRFVGPLGLSGQAVQLVCSYKLEAVDARTTRLILTVNASGEIKTGQAEIVKKVWHHFLVERFKPYIESGKHLQK
jgi:hypothetical protein